MLHSGEDLGERWDHFMRQGRFEAAWNISDKVLRSRAGRPCWDLPRHFQYFWDETPLEGKRVLVRCYHGLGDTIQFIRYAPLLQAVAAEVTYWAQPNLIPLLRTAPGVERLLPLHDGEPDVARDLDVELMELPHVFRTTLETLPTEVPYLHVPTAPRPQDSTLWVGLVWRAGDWDTARSIPFPVLTPLFEIPGITWRIHQRGRGRDEWRPAWGTVPEFGDLLDETRHIRALDLMISIDSMPAHLAGALAVPTWVLLTHRPCWRWMEGRNDSPWYPTMRLFRQEQPGDWRSVVARVAAELAMRLS
jgi:hypothetical protein